MELWVDKSCFLESDSGKRLTIRYTRGFFNDSMPMIKQSIAKLINIIHPLKATSGEYLTSPGLISCFFTIIMKCQFSPASTRRMITFSIRSQTTLSFSYVSLTPSLAGIQMQKTLAFRHRTPTVTPVLRCFARLRFTIKIDTRLMMIWKRQCTWTTQKDRMANKEYTLVLSVLIRSNSLVVSYFKGNGPCKTSQHTMLSPRLDAISAHTIQIYGWLRCPFRRFHMCLVCLIAVHVVKNPNPSVNPQVIDIIDRSVSLET